MTITYPVTRPYMSYTQQGAYELLNGQYLNDTIYKYPHAKHFLLYINNQQNISNSLTAVQDLINEPERFKVFFEEFDYWDYTIRLRLSKWLNFFTSHYSECAYMYTTNICAIAKRIDKNKLLLQQTEYEMESSFSFYKKLFQTNVLKHCNCPETAKYLLTTALIYGKYPGLQIRSIKKATSTLSLGVNLYTMNNFFEALFIKYENPRVFTENLIYLQAHEVDILMYSLQGNNIRTHPKLPIQISKTENFFLMNYMCNSQFKDNVLLRGIALAKLIKVSHNLDKASEFCLHSKLFMYRIDVFLKDFTFWQEVFLFLCRENWKGTGFSMEDFLDHFTFIKRLFYIDKKFWKDKSLTVVASSIHYWENFLGENKQFWTARWHSQYAVQQYKFTHRKKEYIFTEITTGIDLIREGNIMQHCVFSYVRDCLDGHLSIWSMKRITNEDSKERINRDLTIEVSDSDVICQVNGKRNRKPSQGDLKVIEKWAEMANFKIEIQ